MLTFRELSQLVEAVQKAEMTCSKRGDEEVHEALWRGLEPLLRIYHERSANEEQYIPLRKVQRGRQSTDTRLSRW